MAWFRLRDGVPLHYEDVGSGQAIVLVPGWTFTTCLYNAQVVDLSSDHRVITLDLRGAGDSGKTPERHTLADYAQDVIALVHHLQLTEVTLVGWAMGSAVCIHALGIDPSPFARFVWIDHSPRFLVAPDWPYGLGGDLTPTSWADQVHGLVIDRPAATVEMMRGSFYDPPSDDALYEWAAQILKTPTDVMVTMANALSNVDLRPMLHALTMPVLLVNGRHSIVPCAVAEWITSVVPTARSVIFESSGHLPQVEEPERFNTELRQFILSS